VPNSSTAAIAAPMSPFIGGSLHGETEQERYQEGWRVGELVSW
jgi:hypothetical protein